MRPQHKVLLGFAIVLAALAWALTGSGQADPYLDVHSVVDSDTHDASKVISVKGTVAANRTEATGDGVRFTIVDASGNPAHNESELAVIYRGVLPDAFGPKLVVVTGTLVRTADGLVMEATDIQVGCSSKY